MKGYICLHSHYVPAIDDGVRTTGEGIALCQGLHGLGFERLVATPHIKTAAFDNRRRGLEVAHTRFVEEAEAGAAGPLPALGLAAEHWVDDVFWRLFQQGEAVPYPGGRAMLVELPREQLPLRLEHLFFQMTLAHVTPVLAHPERYRPFQKKRDDVEAVTSRSLLLLDLMSLVGKYGRTPRKTAEKMLEEGSYYAACSDAHRPKDVPLVEKALVRLHELVGNDQATELLRDHPQAILDGRAEA